MKEINFTGGFSGEPAITIIPADDSTKFFEKLRNYMGVLVTFNCVFVERELLPKVGDQLKK